MRRYQTFCEAETWHDLEDELASEGCRPVSADAAALDTVCDATQRVASGVLEAQVQLSAQIANGEAVTEREMLSRVRVLRDGPMGELQTTTTKGVSLFRKRLEAKACIGDMVASSKIGYEGPMPNAAEYVEAKLEELEELRIQREKLAGKGKGKGKSSKKKENEPPTEDEETEKEGKKEKKEKKEKESL